MGPSLIPYLDKPLRSSTPGFLLHADLQIDAINFSMSRSSRSRERRTAGSKPFGLSSRNGRRGVKKSETLRQQPALSAAHCRVRIESGIVSMRAEPN